MMKYKIIVWGGGVRGRALINAFDKSKTDIVVIDSYIKKSNITQDGVVYEIVGCDILKNIEFDYVFITPKNHVQDILYKLGRYNVPKEKIITLRKYETLGNIMNLFTDKGYVYIVGMMVRDSVEVVLNDISLSKLWSMKGTKLKSNDQPKSVYGQSGGKKIYIGVVNLDVNDNVTERIISKCSRYIIGKNIDRETTEIINIDIYNPNLRVLCACDAIIFAGGGIIKLNAKVFDFPVLIDNIMSTAELYDIPVMFNGVGVEVSNNIEKYMIMQRAINRNCVKVISVRENMAAMKEYIYNKKIELFDVGDSALFTDEAYGLKHISNNKRKVVGLGTINFINWEREGFPIREDRLIKLYSEIIKELEKKGYEWKIFCNGVPADYKFALKIIELEDEYEEHLIRRPGSDEEWLDVVNSFDAIIAPRLHTNIVAYSLGIPCVPMVWDTKIQYFAEKIGYEDFCFIPDKFEAKLMVNCLEKISINDDIRHNLMKKTEEAVRKFLYTYIVANTNVHGAEELI